MDLDIDNSIEEYIQSRVSPKRYRHLKRCAETAYALCRRNGLDPEKGVTAGLLHDAARERPDEEIIAAAEQGYELNSRERDNPLLAHGKAAAVMVANDLGIHDEEILEAIAYHTAGTPGMGPFARVVFIADYIEPERSHISESFRREVLESDLTAGLFLVLENHIAHLDEKEIPVLPDTRELFRQVKKEVRAIAD